MKRVRAGARSKAIAVAAGCALLGLMAAMAAPDAAAQASVQIYGVAGAYLGSNKISGGSRALTQEGAGGLTTSYLGFKGSEDLGNGYKTIFMLESFFRLDTGAQGRNATDPMFSRNAWMGFQGGFGRVTVGRQTNPTYTNMGLLSPFGTSVVFSPLVLQSFVATYNGAIIGDTVWNNSIEYATPNLAGFTGSAIYGLGEVPGQNGIANTGLHGTYRQGGFTAALSGQRMRVNILTPAPAQQNAYLGGATYDFNWIKLFGSVERTLVDRGNTTRTVDAGVKIPVSASGSILAEAAKSIIRAPGGAKSARLTASAGYDHFLSKRTDVYAIYVFDRNAAFGAAGTIGLGLRHTF